MTAIMIFLVLLKLDHWIMQFKGFQLPQPSWVMSHCTILYKYGQFIQYLQNKVGKIYPHFGVF